LLRTARVLFDGVVFAHPDCLRAHT
jgi:2-methylaconitate cis-trans-isomerase PrpF